MKKLFLSLALLVPFVNGSIDGFRARFSSACDKGTKAVSENLLFVVAQGAASGISDKTGVSRGATVAALTLVATNNPKSAAAAGVGAYASDRALDYISQKTPAGSFANEATKSKCVRAVSAVVGSVLALGLIEKLTSDSK